MSSAATDKRIDPQAKALLDQMRQQAAAQPKPNEPQTPMQKVAAAREGYRQTIPLAGAPEEVGEMEDRRIPGDAGGILVRVYTPRGSDAGGILPIVMYFHGGGFTMGDFDTHDAPLRALANRANTRIIAVAYRLAPENKFPAAPEDCYAATKYVAENANEFGVDARRLAVAGDSAGGNLAAVVALMARDRGAPRVAYQVLLYPNTDATLTSRSWQELADAAPTVLSRDTMRENFAAYLPARADNDDPYISPLKAPDLAGLPAAFVVTGGYDPLRDEGAAYVARLKDAGVAVEHSHYEGMIHGFFQMAGALDAGRRLIDDTAARLRAAFAGRGDKAATADGAEE